MKLLSLALLLATALPSGGAVDGTAVGDRTITQVVKLLQNMLDKSKAEGDTEQELYAKYKCYCDTNEAAKKAEIEHLKEQIALLESEIEGLQGSSAKLSKEVAKLDADMKANLADRNEATSIRNQEHTDYLALKKDLEDAIGQMTEAIKVLSEVGADQTLQAAADHKYFMGEGGQASLAKLKATVKSVLLAAGAYVSQKQAKAVDAFLQAPFTGTYTAQSGEVLGILRDMRDTFQANLKGASEQEDRRQKAHDAYMAEMLQAYGDMSGAYQKKQGELASNDGGLATKKAQLQTARGALAEAEGFLSQLLAMCAAKKTQYNERVALRTSEETALAEAISILNSDAAFATFGTVDATRTGPTALVQLRRAGVRAHRFRAVSPRETPRSDRRIAAREFLQRAAREQGGATSSLLGRIASMLTANNPFTTVIEEIDKMIALIDQEADQDKKHNDWCVQEVTRTNKDIGAKAGEITQLTGEIGVLDNDINHPTAGLKATIKAYEDALADDLRSQQTETEDRREEHAAYEKDIANLVEAEKLIERAVLVLRKYYAKISASIKAEMSLVQSRKRKAAPAPPATWEDKYKGQSEAGGTDAISMLEFILKNTKKEEDQAHSDELDAQHSYEDSMQGLKEEEADLQKCIADGQSLLAQKEETLNQKTQDLAKTEAEKKTLEAYLADITPGCSFIGENLELRNGNRENERAALQNAKMLLRGSPAFMAAEDLAHKESQGHCRSVCAMSEDMVQCKACLADVSIPGYCASHPATSGC